MKKKYLMILLIILLFITLSLVAMGLILDKTENEKQNGLADQFDVSSQNTFAYVNYANGKPQLFLYNEENAIDELVVELDEHTMIIDPSFSTDGSILAFVSTNKDKEKELTSTVHFLDLRSKEISDVFTDESTITEVEFKPDGSSLLYLRAGTFENYSPITGKRPHDFDVYEFDLDTSSHERKTDLSQYSIHSLQVSPDGKKVYLQRDDDSSVETAEDSFMARQRIFEIPLEYPEEMKVISDPEREVDVFSFTITPTGNEMIFQSISNPDSGGTFEYELFLYHLDSKKERQLTHLSKHASNPVVGADGKTIYFMLDTNFGNGGPVNYLYKISFTGDQIEEIILPGSSR